MKKILVGRDTCTGCPIRCKRKVSTSFAGRKLDETFGIMYFFTTKEVGDFYNYPKIRGMLNMISGMETGTEDMLKIGDCNYNLLKVFAAREGFIRGDDNLPHRFIENSIANGT